jgi:hypothetical protein
MWQVGLWLDRIQIGSLVQEVIPPTGEPAMAELLVQARPFAFFCPEDRVCRVLAGSRTSEGHLRAEATNRQSFTQIACRLRQGVWVRLGYNFSAMSKWLPKFNDTLMTKRNESVA